MDFSRPTENISTTMKVLGLLSLCVSACSAVNSVDLLAGDSEFTNLTSFVKAAGLESTLRSGIYTIFAPTNDAFKRVDSAILSALGRNTTALGNLLKYHVVQGKIPSSAASNELKVTSLEGHKVRFNTYSHNNAVTVEGSKIITFDKQADNGVIHVIDRVMMPPSGDIVDVVAGDSDLSTLLSFVQRTNLAGALKGDALTLFAPTNDAFNSLPSSTRSKLLSNPDLLKEILLYHVVPHTEYSKGLYNRETLRTLDHQHDRIQVHASSFTGSIRINNGGTITEADIPTSNGVIHKIKHVLVPYRYIPSLVGK